MAETITWEVAGGKGETKIAEDGTLTVDATETPETKLTVTAKTTVDGKELTGTGVATVKAP
ncbi:hypothetical protein H3009_gp18 [Bacillus phage Harambe]|uniref:Uncharacterized protein n=2 Tax=Harambevirus TaxID=2842721 RepID=A0A1W6JSE3_9CAUD|nr:hypothetical protein H3009_gp18 [Bacillus phage Harambe]YP_009910194.1 hypothetical protein H3010_gp15 [Bacillus phage BeachBum]ARM70167.1 hypothetical protein HARAMBE_18 [Bacillus phage Harambe]ARQ95215.1 hypothetical protein BEACHBUM_15 [Bacillus phage BeachBum]